MIVALHLLQTLSPQQRRGIVAAGVAVGLIAGLLLVQQARQQRALEHQRQAALSAPITTVTALGRLEPEGEVINVAPPSGSMGLAQARLKTLLVEEGERVRQGQLLATMDSLPRLTRAVDEADAHVAIAVTQLQVATATHRSELQTQLAKVRRAEANVSTETSEERRYRDLYRSGATSASLYESRRLSLETAKAELAEAQSRLQRLQAQVSTAAGRFSLDEASAQRELQAARSHRARTQAEREDALVRAPISGRVLSVLTRPGEVPGTDGLVQLGRTDRMQLVAEVYQSDRGRLRLGQPVRITSTALPGPLHGRVSRIGAIVRRQSLINTDPSANTDTRVIEVHALLDQASSRRAAELSNLQVTAVFGP
ncbi:MAG: HlyD family efflux transporter periplasmic adaptor subunit [Cyanobacteriota bacterium]|nr:HlyD family efflux transporter periplasmic adaptor subunit [Cyanobacteriota bacterium]